MNDLQSYLNMQTYFDPFLFADRSNSNYNLGVANEAGQEVNQTDKEAARYYQLASDEGFAPAQFCLGKMYRAGKIILRSNTQAIILLNQTAFKYYNLAAAQNFLPALHELGSLSQYDVGSEIKKLDIETIKKADHYYRIAADQGFAPSQCSLGSWYLRRGLIKEFEKDNKKAFNYRWSELGDIFNLWNELNEKRSKAILKPKTIKELHKKMVQYYNEAFKYYCMACGQNYKPAMVALKNYFSIGIGKGSLFPKIIFDLYVQDSKQDEVDKNFKNEWSLRFVCVMTFKSEPSA